ncbi:hypothetical protein M0804_006454 [Polistes exclamans]|nr:hypothetical protein M0804_006454 [Polistes exclamans]
MKELRKGQLHVRVKRAIKGALNGTLELALNDTCSLYIRRSYTGIFMARREQGSDQLRSSGKIVMHFGPVPLTLANLDRLNAAVRGIGKLKSILKRENVGDESIGIGEKLLGALFDVVALLKSEGRFTATVGRVKIYYRLLAESNPLRSTL